MNSTSTCIVGIAENGKVYIGSDSASGDFSKGTKTVSTMKKSFIVKNNKAEIGIGYTTSWRMGQLLEHQFHPPAHLEPLDVMQYMVKEFVPAVKKLFEAEWHGKRVEDDNWGGTFLVGYLGRILTIDSDFQVNENADSFDSCGCGKYWAMGSLFSTMDLPPLRRLQIALEAATHYSAFVLPPFNFIEIQQIAAEVSKNG